MATLWLCNVGANQALTDIILHEKALRAVSANPHLPGRRSSHVAKKPELRGLSQRATEIQVKSDTPLP